MSALSRDPQLINSTTWYYESPRSLEFYVRYLDKQSGRHETISFRVPASKLERSLRRMDKAPRNKK